MYSPIALVQGEAVSPVAGGQHHHRGRSVQGVAGADLPGARLHEIVLGRFAGRALGAAQDREDGADRAVDVGVGRAIQRVEHQQVLAARILGRQVVDVVHLLGGEGGDVAGPFVALDEQVVGDHIQLFLGLALDVLGVGGAEHAHQAAVADGAGDGLAGDDDVVDQRGEIARHTLDLPLFFDDEFSDGGTDRHGGYPWVVRNRRGGAAR